MWPCWWSAALASFALPKPEILLLLGIGAMLMRPAGCIINDIVDRDLDRQVERTRARPLASGELTLRQAIGVLILLSLASLVVAIALGKAVVLWALPSLALVAAYPWMKRITWWPQLFLGLTFNWGALLGWVAVRGEVDLAAWWLYAGGVFWTLGYDTIYAHQDIEDDARIGIKSTARRLGSRTKPALTAFYAAAVICWAAAGFTGGAGLPFYLLLVGGWVHLAWQVRTVALDDPASCRRVFASNAWFGALIFLACIAGK